ncbi:MAG: hypothetical protein ACPHJE_00445 [Poseidonia sp.]
MKLNCDECNGNLTIDHARAEGTCDVCSLVHENVTTDADTNSGSSLGEGRHNEAVNRNAAAQGAKHGGKMSVWGDKVDGRGNRLTAEQRRRARRMGQLDRSSQRDSDPMYAALMATIRDMFGEDMARAVEPLARATARKLTPAQEGRRRTLNSSERRLLKCPKTAICRAGGEQHPELRGDTDLDNQQIMALAIASLAARWFRTISINEKKLMAAYGITQKQLVNAKKIISQHYKARVRMKWAPVPHQLHIAAAREDDLDKAATNLSDALAARLPAEVVDEVMNEFFEAMSEIGEPSVDAPTANVAVGMVAGCVMYRVLQRMGLADGKLNCVADAVSCSGAGLKSRIDLFKELYEKGEFPGAEALFAVSLDEAKEGSSNEEAEEEGEE